MKGFSPKQIKALIFKARDAFKLLGSRARARGEAWDDSAAAFEVWRHDQVMAAVGKPGLRACCNDDYSALQAHFNDLAGKTGAAFEHHVRAQNEKRRQLEHELVRIMEQGGLDAAYVDAIARAQFKCSTMDCDDKQLTRLLYTIKNRARARTRLRPAATARQEESPVVNVSAAGVPAPGSSESVAPARPACRRCSGRGSILDPDLYADRRDYVTCPACAGTGTMNPPSPGYGAAREAVA